jgi:hypothetical protein
MSLAYVRRVSWAGPWAAIAVALVMLMAAAAPSTAHAQTCPQQKKGTKYKVRIDSAPPGATVYLDRKECGPVGVTPWAGSIPKGDYTAILEIEGYQPATRPLKVIRTRKLQETFVPLVKKQDPPRVDVRADADKNIFGAQVFLDGQLQGQAPVLLTTTAGRHQIEIKREGFDTLTQWIEVKENEKLTLSPTLREVPKPKHGTIVIEADVPDADVLIDGNPHTDKTPTVITNVVEGLHVIEVRKEPALPWKQTVQVQANQQVKVRAELKATIGGQGGSVRVLSNVNGAKVFLDGNDVGVAPVDLKDVKTGEHVIEVKAEGYVTREERVTVNAGSAAVLKLDLTAGGQGGGTLKVVSPVPEAEVFIDGAAIGKVPQEKDVAAGEHFVVVKLPGYKTFEQKVRVEPGQSLTVSAEVKAVGKLRVLSTPPGGQVLVNGMPAGTTPLELDAIEVGMNVIRVEMPGRVAFERTMDIQGGETEVLSADLPIMGPSEEESLVEQRGLASFGARTLPRGRSTIDFGLGYPYYLEGRITVGAGKAGDFGFDAGVGLRSSGIRQELGIGTRFMLVDREPFSAGVFGDLWWGSVLFGNSERNGATFDAGGIVSLTALTRVTVSGRLYLNAWTDRHCPKLEGGEFNADSEPIDPCAGYKARRLDGMDPADFSEADARSMEELTGVEPENAEDMFGRESGARLMASVIAEISLQQQWNLWILLEGVPFQGERALFTNDFIGWMPKTDFRSYFRMGLTYKF